MMNESPNPFDGLELKDNLSSPNDVQPAGQSPGLMPYGQAGDNRSVTDSDGATGEIQARPVVTQPQYGQTQAPEFGALISQFPSGYDPYLYGKPDEEVLQQSGNDSRLQQNQGNRNGNAHNGGWNENNANPMNGYFGRGNGQNDRSSVPNGGFGQMAGNGYDGNSNGFNGQQRYNGGQAPLAGGPGAPGYQPDIRNGVDMNDPIQNPLKGHWDPMAIVSIILLFLPIVFLPIVTGAISMWRTKKYHMKGFWAAAVCVALGVVTTLFQIWLLTKGISADDLMQQLLNQYSPSGTGNGGDSLVTA
ncbi:hypothetical protein FHX77_000108 [Bifidobacterium commune]|nr:hypothetical protein [Bifidobacterium commune]MBB2954728.1 hypothetical protein [Bifidobacterium commune]